MYDIAIIGGGPAGSTAASLLSEKGFKVVLLEKQKFPREHIGESLIPASYEILKKLDVLEELKTISPRKPGVHFISNNDMNQTLWCFKNAVKDESYLSFHVKRSLFDEMLLNNSRKKGATVLEEHQVKQVNLDREDNIVEISAQDNTGNPKTFEAKFLIDASGQNTFLGTKLGVKKPVQDLDRVAIWSHWKGAHFDKPLKQGVIKIVYLGGTEKKGWIWVIPLSKDCLSIGVVVNNSFIKNEKQKLQLSGSEDWKHDLYINEINESAAVSKLLGSAEMNHKVQLNGDYSYFCEKKYGNNFAMIGDAGAFLDPIFSSGIFVGMQTAELMAEALDQKFNFDNDHAIPDAYIKINGALRLIEKFIKLFYSREIIDFSMMGDTSEQLKNESIESTYAIFHYLLAGNFFKHYEKYSDFIDTLKDQKMLEKFQHLISHTRSYGDDATCNEEFEEMYGKMTHELTFDQTAFT
jgi:flavin-dependent dehydrogenase